MLDLNEVVSGFAKMLPHLIGENIKIEIIPGAPSGHVKADPAQIEQVIMNLAVNARDAMPNGGKLSFAISKVDVGEDYVALHPSATAGKFVKLMVSDTGTGMADETKVHLFEPFFTTKGPGKGTGLGLSTIYGIVKQSGGNICVDSAVGKGTTFSIFLPRVEDPLSVAEGQPSAGSPRGTETILLVEDEESLRRLAQRILQSKGYVVLEAANGVEALAIADQSPGQQIHLLLTDIIMPGMNGRELADKLLEKRPGLKVLFTSGYSDLAISHDSILDPDVRLVQKPFSLDTITRAVRAALDQG